LFAELVDDRGEVVSAAHEAIVAPMAGGGCRGGPAETGAMSAIPH
jgi:hypothetical protein